MNTSSIAPKTLRLFGTAPDSIVDGPGLRYAIFVQGCSHGCPGCHNTDSWPALGGTEASLESILEDIHSNGLIHDVTLSGGEPFEQPEACAALAQQLKAEGYGLWAYTGYLWEDLQRKAETHPAIATLLDSLDVLVDGPFVESKKSLGLQWKGSANQRVIDVPQTKEQGAVVLWHAPSFVPDKPPAW